VGCSGNINPLIYLKKKKLVAEGVEFSAVQCHPNSSMRDKFDGGKSLAIAG
jgi:hypothetical protein